MLSTRTLLVALIFAASVNAFAQIPGQSSPTPPAATVTQSATGFDATLGSETLRVTVCSDAAIHVVTHPQATEAALAQPWLLPAAQSCPGTHFDFAQDAKNATLKTAAVTVSLSLAHGNLPVSTPDGKSFLREGSNVPRTYTPVTLNGQPTYNIVDRFSPDATEAIYGLGQHQSGLFNYRGATVQLAQNNTDIAIPVLVSTRGYGILWNSASETYMDNRFPLEIKFSTLSGNGADYFVLYGPEFDQIVHQYRALTGHVPMLPRWSYGFIQSKDRYISLDEIQSIATRYRAEHIPVDTIVQDWFWWKNEGDPIFNSHYHDVPADLAKLHAQHIHTMISTWGMMDPAAETFKKLDAAHLLLKDAHVYDASSPEGRKMFWDNLDGPLFAQGWDSFWLDSAEPEEYFPHLGDAVLNTRTMAIGNGATYTNVYPLLHNQGVQENWRKTTDQKRVFLLTRFLRLPRGRSASVARRLVWRRLPELLGSLPSGPRRPQLRPLRHALLDNRHRRLPSARRHHQPRVPGTLRPLVRVRHLLPHLPHPRPPPQQRAVELPTGRAGADQLRQTPLPHDALPLFARLEGLQRRRDADAPAAHGLPQRSRHLE